jgi:hypothetical protein
MIGGESGLLDDVDLQLQIAERVFQDEGSSRFFPILGHSQAKLSHLDGSDIMTVAGSSSAQHDWRLVMGAISIRRREIAGLGEEFNGTCLQVKYDCQDRPRLVPFLADLVDLVSSGSSTDDALSGTLEEWNDRFRSIHAPLTHEQQRGLFGELCVLSELLENSSSATTWKGPNRSLHDFVSDDWHIEVKTTTTMPGRLKIAPLNQLEPISESLFLAMVKIRADPGGETLKDRVSLVRSLASAEDGIEHIEKMLSLQGYRDSDEDMYQSTYILEGIHQLEIREDTPVLHRVRIDPEVACIQSVRWIMGTESLPFTEATEDFWESL